MSLNRFAGIVLLVSWLTDGPALAQGSSMRERILANPRAEIGRAIGVVAVRDYASSRGGEIAINWCHVYAEWGETRDDDFLEHFEHVAQEHVHMRQMLYAAGYPAESFREALAGVTMAYLREIERRRNDGRDLRDIAGIKRALLPYERRLAERMIAYRQQFDRTLARPNVWNECGGDYVGYVKLRALPDGGTIRLIREFYYKFCQATGIRPFSNDCDKWSVVASSRDVPGGIYYYIVSWPNGYTECDRIEFSGASPNEDDKIITIRQSGKGCSR